MSAMDTVDALLATATEAPATSPVVDTPVEPAEPPPDTNADVAVDSPTPEGEGEGTGGAEGGPKVPTTQQIRASLKAFRDANPEHAQAAKLLNDGYSRFEAYKQVFPTVDDARSVKATLDTVGGLEGLANMQQILSTVDETDALLDAGDPQVLDRILEDSPDGFKKLAPAYLTKLQKADPEVFNRVLQPHFVHSLADANFPQVVDALASMLADKPEALKIVQSMKQWFDGQKAQADRTSADTLNPEREAFNKERETFAKERQSEFQKAVGGELDGHIRQELGTRLKPYSGALNALPVAVRQDVARAAINILARAVDADKTFQTQNSAMLGARKPDRAKIVALNKAKVSALADQVIAQVVKNYSLTAGAVKAKPGAKAGTQDAPKSNAILKLSKPPSDADIDWEYPDAQKAFIMHRAALKESVVKSRGLKSRFVSW